MVYDCWKIFFLAVYGTLELQESIPELVFWWWKCVNDISDAIDGTPADGISDPLADVDSWARLTWD